MRAFIVEGAGRTLPATAKVRETAPKNLASRIVAGGRGAIVFLSIAAAVVATIIALSIATWAAGHPDHPFVRELAKLFG